ncbi:hypothetical protein [Cronobacter sakazakii]|nr:hypothetical protein [Cronobacter sakazakii]
MALVTSFGEKVNNLSVGKKLTSGFIIVLCIMLLIADCWCRNLWLSPGG